MKIRLLPLFLSLLLLPSLAAAATLQTLEVEFSFAVPDNMTEQLLGYRLYKEGQQLCETSDPLVSSISCEFSTEDGTFNFTLAAYYANGSESPHSPPFPFTISTTSPPGGDLLQAVIDPTPASGAVPLAVSFSASGSTGEITGYQWDFGDGTTGTGLAVSHNYPIAGTYTATLQITGPNGATDQVSTTITAQPGTVPVLPPTAVLTSSTAAGTAPLTVTFDGTGSTSPNPPLASYSWTFGDGSQATGPTASYTFTAAGTYYATLTVEDSLGQTNSVQTPIVVSAAPATNQKPQAAIAASLPGGVAPITISFDGSQSSDPDGSIAGYHWNFGDGTTGTGQLAQHSFTTAGIYTVSLRVTDNRGATATATREIVCNAAAPATNFNIEVGEVRINHRWVKVLFGKTFNQPIIVAGPPTSQDPDPVLVRIRNIDRDGFEVRLQEWDYQDGRHSRETFSYIVMEQGSYTLDNGTKIEAGSFTGRRGFRQVPLQQAYAQNPVILTQILSNNDPDAVTGRVRNIGSDSFAYLLQEQQTTRRRHRAETVGYIAWEPGQGTLPGLVYEVGTTSDGVTRRWFNLTYQSVFSDLPHFIAGMQTCDAIDPAAVRSKNTSETRARIMIQEELSKDAENRHAAEIVGYLAIGAATP